MSIGWRGDVTDGIQGTTIKAGIIKCGTDRAGLTPINHKVLQVSARLHRATGLPITTHTHVANRSGLLQQDVFEREGVDLSHVVIGHSGDTSDLDYLETILRRGSFIGMDRFGHPQIYPFDKRVATIAELCRRGWADRMVLAHDADLYSDWSAEGLDLHIRGEKPLPFCRITEEILPMLRQAGVSEEHIHLMTVENPRRALAPA